MQPRANALLAALLLCLATLPMTVSAQVDPIQNDFAYGVEYDWSNLDEDIDSLTGINLNEILSRTMLAASDAGLNLTVAQLSTGSSNIFVESAEDRTPTTIDLDGDVHDVWMRMTDVTIRHAVLFDSALITEWVDASGADPAGFDGYLSVDSENAVAVDVNMIEYLDDDYNLYGVDMDFSLASEVSVEYMMDVGVEGGGEDFGFAVTFGTAFDFDVPSSSAEWRLGHETPVLSALSTYESVHAECDRERLHHHQRHGGRHRHRVRHDGRRLHGVHRFQRRLGRRAHRKLRSGFGPARHFDFRPDQFDRRDCDGGFP